MTMHIDGAIKCFEENLRILSPQDHLERYNLNSGLRGIALAAQGAESRLLRMECELDELKQIVNARN